VRYKTSGPTYVIEISKFLCRATAPAEEDNKSTPISVKDIQALLWLAHNARDPTVVGCSYQALAGLHRPADKVQLCKTSIGKQSNDSPITSDDAMVGKEITDSPSGDDASVRKETTNP
jgi:hypothetical protein